MPQEQDDPPVVETPETQPDLLPETAPDEGGTVDVEALKAEAAREKEALAAELKAEKEQREKLEKRVKDNQDYISRTRNAEKLVEKPAKTFEDYEKEVLETFENDPKAGLQRILRDVAFDRDLERKEMDRRITEAEEKAFRRAVSLDPEKAKVFDAVEKLNETRPDLANLTFDQKMEFVKMMKGADGAAAAAGDQARARAGRAQDMASDAGGGALGRGRDKTPSWLNDPEVQRAAQGMFKSKEELAAWADPVKAREMGMRMRQQS